ncbi:MAG: hypothetical protein JNJ58_06120 [Chitinophagaceae bacterium]|nr:hypothetical protein [Chitinophagaceae bacterium]
MKATDLFDRRIFWDVDPDKLDLEAKASFIITRVFDRGDVPDIRNCRRYYGDERVKEVLTQAKYISKETLHLASAIFNNPLTDYRCYIQIPLTGKPWLY